MNGTRPLSKLTPPHLDPASVRAYLAELGRRGDARSSMARKLSGLRTFVRYLRREGVIDDDPASLAMAPRREQTLPAHLTRRRDDAAPGHSDAQEPLGRRDRAILELFYASGLRLSELVGLDLEDVDLARPHGPRHGQGLQGADGAVQPGGRERDSSLARKIAWR